GQIYPELHRLVANGLAVSRGGTKSTRRTRIVYAITSKGRKEFREWLVLPAAPQPVRNELLLKLYFGWELDLAAADVQIAAFEQSLRTLGSKYEEARREIAQDEETDLKRLSAELSLDLGQRLLDARLAWCEAARRRLAKRPGKAHSAPPSTATSKPRVTKRPNP
ncbi:MAG: PadR family transcriptional regulator, partial [Planctomycetota bacterium]|nr:PadR family transcriptional regulator [Planctomycetota bacterium]